MTKQSEIIPYVGVSTAFFCDVMDEMDVDVKDRFIPLINDYYSQGDFISYPVKAEQFNMMANLTSFIANNYLINSFDCTTLDEVKNARLLMVDFLKLQREELNKRLMLPASHKEAVINLFINERKEYNSNFFKNITKKLNVEKKNREYLAWLNND